MPDHLKLTREELYSLVWSKPMTEVGQDFQISDRAMAKIIRAIRHRRRVCRFPASQHLLLRALGLVPTSVRQIALRRAFHPLFRYRPITAAADAAPRSVT